MKKLTVAVLVLMILFVMGCSQGGSVARSEWHIGSAKTFSDELTFNEKGRIFQQVSLKIDVQLSGGTVSWEAYGPNGDLLFTSSTQGSYREKMQLEPLPGQWRLVVNAADAVGDIEFIWQGKK